MKKHEYRFLSAERMAPYGCELLFEREAGERPAESRCAFRKIMLDKRNKSCYTK